MRPRSRPGARHTKRVPRSRWQLVLRTAVVLLPGFVAAAPAADDPRNVYLMALAVGDRLLADAVVTYENRGRYFIDFESFLSAVEFPIEQRGRTWSGWFRAKENRFSWNMDDGAVQTGGSENTRPGNTRWIESDANSFTRIREDRQWLETGEGIFVATDALEQWFDLELTADARLQTIAVVSAKPLPFQQRLARAATRSAYRPGGAPANRVRLPDQYRWFTLPLVDLTVNHRTWSTGASDTGSDTGTARDDSTDVALTAGMDLLKHSAIYTGDIVNDGPQRLTIGRGAATSAATLPLGATRYVLGDVVATHSNLVGGGGGGTGFRVERRRNGPSGSLNLLTITGNAPPGWDVELYRNGVLITFGVVGSDGRYLFPGQDTVYGENVFLVRLFGPRGEVDERRHVYWGGGVELEPGDYSFSLSHVDFTRDFLDGSRSTINGLASARTTDVRYAYALNDDLQLGAAYTWAELGSRSADGSFTDTGYAALDAQINLGRGLLLTEWVGQQSGGKAWSTNFLTTFAAQNVSLSHQSFDDFESPYTVRNVKLDSQNQLSLSGPLNLLGLRNYTLRITHENRADGLLGYRVFNRLGSNWGPVSVSNDLEYVYVESGNPSYRGYLRIAGRRGQLNFRAEVDYDPAKSDPVNQLSGTIGWAMSRRVNTSLTVRRNVNGGQTYIDSRSSIRMGPVNLFFDLYAGSDDSWSAALGFNTRFGYDPDTSGFFSADRSLAHSGRVRLNLFVDDNNNGLREPDEAPVQWASYRGIPMPADTPGVLPLTGVPGNTPVLLQGRDLLFDDPFLSATADTYELYTHAGSNIDVHIPVVVTGDVEGYLYPGSGMDRTDVRGVVVTLYDADGREVARTVSEFDGYYAFSGIPVGEYELAVIPDADRPDYHKQWFTLDTNNNYRMMDPIHLWKL